MVAGYSAPARGDTLWGRRNPRRFAEIHSEHRCERLARFEPGNDVLASLTRSQIAHIYGVEETGGVPALVMELVEGRSERSVPRWLCHLTRVDGGGRFVATPANE